MHASNETSWSQPHLSESTQLHYKLLELFCETAEPQSDLMPLKLSLVTNHLHKEITQGQVQWAWDLVQGVTEEEGQLACMSFLWNFLYLCPSEELLA